MMTAESMLSKCPVLRMTEAVFFLLKPFSSRIYCATKLKNVYFNEMVKPGPKGSYFKSAKCNFSSNNIYHSPSFVVMFVHFFPSFVFGFSR